jgi:glycosyltransferase involved in cell wall biosynthesis
MNKGPYVSVIIPIYNVEKYLQTCLESLVNQTLAEIEIICVNDGSTDKSLEILEEFAQKDERIKIISKKNEGIGAARKTGLDVVSGQFIAFLDSDDWLKPEALEELYKNAISNNSDLVMFDLLRYDENYDHLNSEAGIDLESFFKNEKINFENFIFTYRDIKPYLLNKSFAPWTKLYKTSLLKNYDDFYFPKHTTKEDVPFHVQIMLRAEKISYCPKKLYIYRISNIESISNVSSASRKVFDTFQIIKRVEDILNENKKTDEFRYEFVTFKISQLIHWMKKCNVNFKKEFFDQTKKEFEIMDLSSDDMNELNNIVRYKYKNIMESKSFKEYELLEKIFILKSDYDYTLKNQYNELSKEIVYYKEKANCLQKKQSKYISQIKSFKRREKRRKKQIRKIANTKPYRMAYILRRFTLEFLNGDSHQKKIFIKWIYCKIARKSCGLEHKYNLLIRLSK